MEWDGFTASEAVPDECDTGDLLGSPVASGLDFTSEVARILADQVGFKAFYLFRQLLIVIWHFFFLFSRSLFLGWIWMNWRTVFVRSLWDWRE